MFQMSTANFPSTTNPSSSSTTSTYSPFRLTTPSIVSLSTTENHLLPLSNHHSQTSTTSSIFSSICIDTPVLGQLPSTIVKHDEQPLTNNEKNLDDCTQMSNAPDPIDHGEDSEIELFINNVVCSFASGCQLNLKKIAMEAANVIYRRDQSMVLMKIRNPYCSANLWSSGKVTVTGTTSEDDAERAARRIARCLQRLGFKVKFRNFRVVNCLATCAMPWPIDIVKLSRKYPDCVSYEPEIHPGATVRLNNKAVLKVFTTGRITLTAPSVERINTAVNEFYPQLFECRRIDGAS